MLGLSVSRYPLNTDGIFKCTIISLIDLNLYPITQYVTIVKHKRIKMKHMLYQ